MSAVLRCTCPRCAGAVLFHRVSDYLAAHDLAPSEYVLESEVELDELEERRPATSRTERFVGRFEDGSEVLVESYTAGKMTAAVRSHRRATWGPPTFLDIAP